MTFVTLETRQPGENTTPESRAIVAGLIQEGLMEPHYQDRASFIFGCSLDTFEDFVNLSDILDTISPSWRGLETKAEYFDECLPQLICGFRESDGILVATLEIIKDCQLPEVSERIISEEVLFDLARDLKGRGYRLYGA